jgi:DHA1 family tetracycline resistance protein-like MFS transporter
VAGLACGAVGFAIYGLAPTGATFLLGIPVMSFWGLYGPAAQGLMTQRVCRSAQGALQGALASLQTATGIFGPALFSETFAAAISTRRGWHVPGAPFLLASMFLIVGVVVALRITRAAAAEA